jgi:hypothetical protein
MKTHKIRHNGRETEFVDAHTARGLLGALQVAENAMQWVDDISPGRHMLARNIVAAALAKVNPEPATAPEPRQPLEAADIPPGSVVRKASWPDGSWEAVTSVSTANVTLSGGKIRSYEHLRERVFHINRPGEGWKPCSKPGEDA